MHRLRRIFVHAPRERVARWGHRKALAALLVILMPGGFALPFVYGLYGAIRHTLTPKAHSRNAAPEQGGVSASTLENEARP